MARVVVIGAGVGGLSAALHLRAAGHGVTVIERAQVGGKLSSTEIDGFHFDTGPSLLTLPDVFADLFAAFNEDIADHLDLIRLERPFRYRFSDGSGFDVFDDPQLTRASFDGFVPGGGAQWDAMWQHTSRVWEVAERSFFAGAMESPIALMRRMRSPHDFLTIDPLRTVDSRARSLFSDERLQMWFNRYATYSGSSPFRAPATLGCIPYIEQHFGSWHIKGGLSRLATALTQLATAYGVDIVEGVEVEAIEQSSGRMTAVHTSSGRHDADVVVSDVDASHLYERLLPNGKRLARAHKAGRSSAGFAMLLGVDATDETTLHHNVYFSSDQRREFGEIFGGNGVASEPTIYVCNSSASDDTQAPAGAENWFVLVNVAEGAATDWSAYGDKIIDRLGVESRLRFRRDLGPGDAIYGTSSNGRRSAFLRASNRGPVGGLYLCGGSAHPGGGLPLVAMSGRIVAAMIDQDGY